MSNINKVTLEGRLTRDPETKYTANGKRLCTFSIAVNYSVKVEDKWESRLSGFFDCTAWEQAAEAAGAFHKGDPVYLEGSLKQETWEQEGAKRSRVVVNVREIRLADWAKKTAPKEEFVEVNPTPKPDDKITF